MSAHPTPVSAPSSSGDGPEFAGLRATVMGLGLFGGGVAVSRFLTRRGAQVTVTDQRSAEELAPALRELEGCDVRTVLGEHRVTDFTDTDLVIANPAVAPTSPYLESARAARVKISSETALFLEHCPARIAAITGTQGKSSTCNTLAQLLEHAGIRVHLGGNIGRSLLEIVDQMSADDVVVLEISSYQLEALDIESFARRPRMELVAVTNVLADHIERHGSLERYAAAKRRILDLASLASGSALLSAEEAMFATWNAPGVRRIDVFPTRASNVGLNFADGNFRRERTALGRVDSLRLPGLFQRENTLYALGMAQALGASPARLARAIEHARGLPHRLEDLGLYRGHRVWDNAVSTTPDSTLAVMPSLADGFTLVCGGKPKALALEPLLDVAHGRVRRVVVFGAAVEPFAPAFRARGFETWTAPTVEGAIALAFEHMTESEELLFSPACASFDAYLNFKERALAFRRALPAQEREPPRTVRTPAAR